MVNVNAQLPFNIHNKPHHRLHGRSDRSLSMHRDPSCPGASASRTQPSSPTAAAFEHSSAARMPSYSRSRDPSPSIQTSHSTTSLHPGDASYLPPDADPDGGPRGPLFNVRLVRGDGGIGIGTDKLRQGRNVGRGRLGRFSEERGRTLAQASDAYGDAAQDSGRGHGAMDGEPAGPEQEPAGACTSAVGDECLPAEEGAQQGLSPHVSNFTIQDVGKIAESWGD